MTKHTQEPELDSNDYLVDLMMDVESVIRTRVANEIRRAAAETDLTWLATAYEAAANIAEGISDTLSNALDIAFGTETETITVVDSDMAQETVLTWVDFETEQDYYDLDLVDPIPLSASVQDEPTNIPDDTWVDADLS